MSPSSEPTTQRNAAATRVRILDAARVLFSESSFEAVTVRSIAAEAGVDAALIKRYFGSKQRLFMAVMGEVIEIDEVIDLGIPQLTHHILRRLDEGVHHALAIPFVGDPSSDDIAHFADELVTRLSEPIAARLAGLNPSDELRVSARRRADLIVSVLVGIGFTRNVLQVDVLKDAELDDLVEWVTPALLALVAPDSA